MTEKIYCSCCGAINNTNNTYCSECGEILHLFEKFEQTKEINTISELFTNMHKFQLNNKILTEEIYETIIHSIIEVGKNRITYRKNMNTLDRVIAIANAYSIVISKENGKTYGEYAFNVICVDKQFDSAIQIATLLHELTHHLFNEIISSILIYTWNVKKTPMIDSFMQTMLSIPEILLISEYCASSTEKYYLPEDYVSYSSFNSICEDINYDKNKISRCLIIGNSMHNSIIEILNSFIDDSLKNEIKEEFRKNNTKPIAKSICIEDSNKTNTILRNVYLMDMIVNSYDMMDKEDIYPIINKNKNYFEKSQHKGAYY